LESLWDDDAGKPQWASLLRFRLGRLVAIPFDARHLRVDPLRDLVN
jgi:hypothetical protein